MDSRMTAVVLTTKGSNVDPAEVARIAEDIAGLPQVRAFAKETLPKLD